MVHKYILYPEYDDKFNSDLACKENDKTKLSKLLKLILPKSSAEKIETVNIQAELPLTFYSGYSLYLLAENTKDTSGRIHFIAPTEIKGQPDDIIFALLNGTSPPIHELNAKLNDHANLKIDEETAHDYLRFFCTWVHGDDGAFSIIDMPDDLDWENQDNPAYEAFSQLNFETIIKPTVGDSFLAAALVGYAKALFSAEFDIKNTGMIEMTGDDPILTELPYRPFKYSAADAYLLEKISG